MLTPQQASKMATISQIAAPQGWRDLIWIRGKCPLCWTPQQASKVATVSQIAAPQGWRGLVESAAFGTVLSPPAGLKSGDSFTERSPPRDGEV